MNFLLKTKKSDDWLPECSIGKILAFYARNVPSHPGKIRIFKWLSRLNPKPIFSYQEKSRIQCILNDYIGHAICFQGAWEPLSLAACIKLMKGNKTKTFLDIGANHGIFSIVVGSITGCPCVAVEPMLRNYQILTENLRLNRRASVQTFRCAATAENTRVSLSSERTGAEAWTKITGQAAHQDTNSMEGRPLKQILQEARCRRVRLMKIDVEGFEVEVFKGMNWDSPATPEVIVMECQPWDSEKISYLTQRGYQPETVDGRSTMDLPEYPEGNLIFRRK
jgi:FkbM family methyltransferase